MIRKTRDGRCVACGGDGSVHRRGCREAEREAREQLQATCDHVGHGTIQTTGDPPGPPLCRRCQAPIQTTRDPRDAPIQLFVDRVSVLRELALRVTAGHLRRPWRVQTSNSFRRIGTDLGDGDVLCATSQRSDGHPDLLAAPGVLDYVVAAHPFTVLELIRQAERCAHAVDHLRRRIEGHDAAFAEATAMMNGHSPPGRSPSDEGDPT